MSGQHDITLTAEDEAGLTTSDTVSIVVQGPNEAPICALSTPSDGSVFLLGRQISLSATVTDINQASEPGGDLDLKHRWRVEYSLARPLWVISL